MQGPAPADLEHDGPIRIGGVDPVEVVQGPSRPVLGGPSGQGLGHAQPPHRHLGQEQVSGLVIGIDRHARAEPRLGLIESTGIDQRDRVLERWPPPQPLPDAPDQPTEAPGHQHPREDPTDDPLSCWIPRRTHGRRAPIATNGIVALRTGPHPAVGRARCGGLGGSTPVIR